MNEYHDYRFLFRSSAMSISLMKALKSRPTCGILVSIRDEARFHYYHAERDE